MKLDEDIFDKNPEDDPLHKRVYWAVRRFWINHWLCNPRDVYRNCVWAYQRLTRGWDDRASWSVDTWLNGMMPDILRMVRDDKHGVPVSMFDGLPTNEDGNPTDEFYIVASGRWTAIMNKMIDGFEAHRRMDDGLYEDELGEYPTYRPKSMGNDDWTAATRKHLDAVHALEERDQKIFEEGMSLFIKYYQSLWT
jgi:hypothetical protein